jgi:uncharacterized membrane protein
MVPPMEDPAASNTTEVHPGLLQYTHLMYGLHALSILTGLVTAATIAGRFVFGWPSILAVIMNYARLRRARGTWLESHFRWQLRSFWIAAILIVCLSPLVFTFILIPLVIGLFTVVGIWATWRIARGWLALREGRPLPIPRSP